MAGRDMAGLYMTCSNVAGLVTSGPLGVNNFGRRFVKKSQLVWKANQRYTYRVLQTIQMKLILLWVWAERAVLGRAKTALKFKYRI